MTTFDRSCPPGRRRMHPPNAHRHTLDEIQGWCARLDLDITYSHVQDSGYTVRARKGAIS